MSTPVYKCILIFGPAFTTIPVPVPSQDASATPTITDTPASWPTWTDYLYGPTTGPQASAVTCNAYWVEYDGRSAALHSLGPTSVQTDYSSYATSQGACETRTYAEGYTDTHTGPVTTLCDSVTRALGPRESVTSVYPGTGPCVTGFSTFAVETSLYREPESTPTCSVDADNCAQIWSTYRSLSSAYESSPTSVSPIAPWSCSTSKAPRPTGNACDDCHFNVETATLFYWPKDAEPNICPPSTAIPLDPTPAMNKARDAPSTVVLDGHTLVSPSAYISIDRINAASNRRVGPGGFCGEEHSSTIISVNPTDLYTVRQHNNGKYPTIGTRYPLDVADFNVHSVGSYIQSLVPWDAYKGGNQCPFRQPELCTMVRDDYSPWLELPQEVRGIDSNWGQCDLKWNLPVIVPVAIGSEIVIPTPAAKPFVESALPRSQVAAPTPVPTGAGEQFANDEDFTI